MALINIDLEGDPTLAAIDRIMEAKAAAEPPRDYLGSSIIGEECSRKLWYGYTNAPRKPFNAATLRRFECGHRGEDIMAERLRSVPGIELWTVDEATGGQIGGKLFNGRFGWHADGVILGLLQAPLTPHIWEHKQVNEKKFAELKKLKEKHGEKAAFEQWDYTYYAQGVLYMELLDLTRHYLTVSTPGGRDYTSCRTNADPRLAKALLAKAERIVNATSEPERMSDNPSHFKCRMCDFREVCHG